MTDWKAALIRAALDVGRDWNMQDGLSGAALDALGVIVKGYDAAHPSESSVAGYVLSLDGWAVEPDEGWLAIHGPARVLMIALRRDGTRVVGVRAWNPHHAVVLQIGEPEMWQLYEFCKRWLAAQPCDHSRGVEHCPHCKAGEL